MTKKIANVASQKLLASYDLNTVDARAACALVHRTAIECAEQFDLRVPEPILIWLDTVARAEIPTLAVSVYPAAVEAFAGWQKPVGSRATRAYVSLCSALRAIWAVRVGDWKKFQYAEDYMGRHIHKLCGNAIAFAEYGPEWVGNAMEIHEIRDATFRRWLEYVDAYGGNGTRIMLRRLSLECAAMPADGKWRQFADYKLCHVAPAAGVKEHLLVFYKEQQWEAAYNEHGYWQEAVPSTCVVAD